MKIPIISVSIVMAFATVAYADTIKVGLGGGYDFDTIQAAINASYDGDVVIVADGTYTGRRNRDINFRGKAITVRSTDPNDPNIVATTIIDCNGTRQDPHRGFKFNSGESPKSVVAGFTITNGHGPIDYIEGQHKSSVGGAIYCLASSPTISNCILTGNSASNGGGICCCEGSSPTVKNCAIVNNVAFGGGMYCLFSSPKLINCIISNNEGGVVCEVSSPIIHNCTITGNLSTVHGGGGISCYRGNPIIYNCTITGNSSGYWGGILCYSDCVMTVSNCIVWDNWPQQITGTVSVTYSDVQGRWHGEGNINIDPCFVEAGYWDANNLWVDGDYHLLEGSPCIDAGDPNYVTGPNETDLDGNPRVVDGDNDGNSVVDMGAFERMPEPTEFIAWLLEDVGGLGLPGGTENSLMAKLNSALGALEDENGNNDAVAANTLQAFINAVEAQRGKKISQGHADFLIEQAQQIIDLMQAPS